MKIAVLGAFGQMGEACLYDLCASPAVTRILAADRTLGNARSVLSRLPQRRKVRVLRLDLASPSAKKRLAGAEAVVNCAWYESNLQAMSLALALKAHYVDLGGLYHMTLKQLRLGPAFRRIGREDRRGIQVGFLSRIAFDEFEHVVDVPAGAQPTLGSAGVEATTVERMGRGALRVRLTKDESTVDVITAHLKSKLLTFSGPRGRTRFDTDDETERVRAAQLALLRRAAEAATLRRRANELLEAGAALIVLGDFNDVPDAATSQILAGPSGSQPPSRAFHVSDQRDPMRLFNLAGLIDEGRRYSRVHRGRRELLDQIFASESLFPRDESGGPRRLPDVDSDVDFADGLTSIGNDPRTRGELAPDHAPVVARFAL